MTYAGLLLATTIAPTQGDVAAVRPVVVREEAVRALGLVVLLLIVVLLLT